MLQQDEQTRVGGVGRFKELLAVAVLPVLTGYAAIATVLATVAALATESKFSVTGVLLAAGPGWLTAYQVPVVIGDNELGLLPLALTIGVSALVARSAFGAADRLGYRTPRQACVVIGTVGGTHAVVGVAIALLANGAVVTADPLDAFGVPGLVSGAAAIVGVARRCGLLDVVRPHVDPAAIAGMRASALGMAGLLAASALLLTVATAFAVPTIQALFVTHAPGFGSGFGMLLLCLGYVPNAVLAVLAFLLGPGFTLGATSLGPVTFESGPMPAVPLLAGLPDSHAPWWPALFLLPALIGAGVGWTLRASSAAPMERIRSVAVAGAMIGFVTVVLTTLAGGGLGGGPFPGLLLPAGLLSVAAFAWIFFPGALVTWLAGPRAVSPAPDAEFVAPDADFAVDDGEFDAPDVVFSTGPGEFSTGAGELDGADVDDAEDTLDAAPGETSDAEYAADVEDQAEDVDDVEATADVSADSDTGSEDTAESATETAEPTPMADANAAPDLDAVRPDER
ncbi:MAG: hypothetical protein GEV04_00675 [Actinophytocola sp.]|nr:hypothetical protein [Actinophytocola sp.]